MVYQLVRRSTNSPMGAPFFRQAADSANQRKSGREQEHLFLSALFGKGLFDGLPIRGLSEQYESANLRRIPFIFMGDPAEDNERSTFQSTVPICYRQQKSEIQMGYSNHFNK
ncbi:hypothetical protein CDAR_393551 [Caerostris darwini]|uniref:Uncharacterized protein n=1 Tax=Caerostris darwini TaxID=1538125 RepID=A0AAV4W6W9_9ARAC|nr:hypothetical protein CDAR_393551 [Caerostris darwini]